ncbi:MAG: glutaredoxin family protein [Anaerolineae bacterium]|nr:glutaredoxin family protein [Anaerolineae bacterium]
MYSRTFGCPFISVAKRVLADHAVAYREIMIDKNPEAKQRVLDWTGFLSVPTLIVAAEGEDLPVEPPLPLARGTSPQGIDRGVMITEPSFDQLERWLAKHGFITGDGEADNSA